MLQSDGSSGAIVRRFLTIPVDEHAFSPRPGINRSAAVRAVFLLSAASRPEARSLRKNLDAYEFRAIAGADE
jgi:hypothetical protein